MRNPIAMKRWPICLLAAATAACSYATAENNVAASNEVAVSNEVAPDAGNEAAPSAESNAAWPADPDNAAVTFRASGTEPFWSLTMSSQQMVYDAADGPDVTVATPPVQQTRAGPRYETPELKVVINTVTHCEGASGQEHGNTVRVIIGGRTVTGCGEGDPPD